jgi:hypothetical protein
LAAAVKRDEDAVGVGERHDGHGDGSAQWDQRLLPG